MRGTAPRSSSSHSVGFATRSPSRSRVTTSASTTGGSAPALASALPLPVDGALDLHLPQKPLQRDAAIALDAEMASNLALANGRGLRADELGLPPARGERSRHSSREASCAWPRSASVPVYPYVPCRTPRTCDPPPAPAGQGQRAVRRVVRAVQGTAVPLSPVCVPLRRLRPSPFRLLSWPEPSSSPRPSSPLACPPPAWPRPCVLPASSCRRPPLRAPSAIRPPAPSSSCPRRGISG